MALPDYQTLMLPVLRIAAEGETTLPHVVEAVASEFGVTSEERELTIQSGTQTLLYNRVAWAKTGGLCVGVEMRESTTAPGVHAVANACRVVANGGGDDANAIEHRQGSDAGLLFANAGIIEDHDSGWILLCVVGGAEAAVRTADHDLIAIGRTQFGDRIEDANTAEGQIEFLAHGDDCRRYRRPRQRAGFVALRRV